MLGVLVLKPLIEALPGRYVGIMLPASVGAGTFYLACLFAGKTPVMVNWTTGPRNIEHALDVLGVQKVITARALLAKLATLGIPLDALGDRLLPVEDSPRSNHDGHEAPRARPLRTSSWAELKRVRPPDEAVVLFTSGSESLPKAVPLTHGNILTNIRDVMRMVEVRDSDRAPRHAAAVPLLRHHRHDHPAPLLGPAHRVPPEPDGGVHPGARHRGVPG